MPIIPALEAGIIGRKKCKSHLMRKRKSGEDRGGLEVLIIIEP
jgi:hypothetical protein